MNIRIVHLLRDQVLVKPAEPETRSIGGIELPDQAIDTSIVGEVRYLGPEVSKEINVGNTVLYGAVAGSVFLIEGEEMILMTERNVRAVVEKISDPILAPVSDRQIKQFSKQTKR